MLMANAEKPVTIAIDELRSGRIDYEELDQAEEPFGRFTIRFHGGRGRRGGRGVGRTSTS